MAFIEPNGYCYLLSNVGLSNDYQATYDWTTSVEQQNFFISKKLYEVSNCRYIKQTNQIKVPFEYDRIYACDYIMYQNLNFNGKWFYAFIVKKEYVNDNTTLLTVELDSFQTWYFEVQYHPSFIVRKHTQQKTSTGATSFYQNIYPESLEFGGDYVTVYTHNHPFTTWYCLICSSAKLESNPGTVSSPNLVTTDGGVFDRVPSALSYYVVDNLPGNGSARTSTLNTVLAHIDAKPWIAQCIQSMTMVPKQCIGDNWTTVSLYGSTATIGVLDTGYVSPNATIQHISNYLNYFPNYNWSKLYSFPYSYIELTSYTGQSIIIKPELMTSADLDVKMLNYIGATPRLAFYVDGYASQGDNGMTIDGGTVTGDFLNNAVIQGNFPQLPVMIDNYNLYMANNANMLSFTQNLTRWNQKEGMVRSGISGLTSMLSGNIFGGLMNGATGIYDSYKSGEVEIRKQMAQIQDAQLTPPSIGAQAGGDAFNIANGVTGITIKWKTLRTEYAQKLSRYFERYGYAFNEIGNINFKGMSVFNYIQTMDCALTGNIPDEDLNKIKRMFNDGITFWHNHNAGSYVIGGNTYQGG